MANSSSFRITTPISAGLQRDPSTGRLMAGVTPETAAPSPTRLQQQASAQGVDILEVATVAANRAPSGPSALPGPAFVRPALPFRLG